MEAISIGLLFVLIGILLRFFPNLLAGYGSLPQREKENAKKNGVPAFASTVFISMGILVIGGYVLSIWLDSPSLTRSVSLVVTLTGVIVIIVVGNILINRRTN